MFIHSYRSNALISGYCLVFSTLNGYSVCVSLILLTIKPTVHHNSYPVTCQVGSAALSYILLTIQPNYLHLHLEAGHTPYNDEHNSMENQLNYYVFISRARTLLCSVAFKLLVQIKYNIIDIMVRGHCPRRFSS